MSIVVAFFASTGFWAFLTILGIMTDPTTAGISDSKQALGYDTPKKDAD